MADVRDEELARLIGLNITKRLIAHNRNQQDLADYLGVSKSTVSMWVNGPERMWLFLAYLRGFRRRLLENVLVTLKKGPHF